MADKNFSEWSQHVLEQLVELNANYNSLREDFQQLNRIITGNGTPELGVIVKLDRLEQESKRRSVWTKAAIGASISAVFGVVGIIIKFIIK